MNQYQSGYDIGYTAGLEEAYRLLNLDEELDYGPGRIVDKIKQMKSTPDTTEPDRTSMSREQLESALAQREDQLRRAEARLKESAKDWADDDTAIREICKPYLSELELNGDSYGVPTMIEVVRRAVDKVEAQCAAMREALEFYGDPETYFAIAILPDPPCGEFADDYSETNTDLGVRHGKKAREALATDCGKSILERLETARDLLSRCPGIRTDETREYWDEVQAFLGKKEK